MPIANGKPHKGQGCPYGGSASLSAGECVRRQAYTNGIEFTWLILRHGAAGALRQFAEHHLPRCVNRFAGCYNAWNAAFRELTAGAVTNSFGKRQNYRGLIA